MKISFTLDTDLPQDVTMLKHCLTGFTIDAPAPETAPSAEATPKPKKAAPAQKEEPKPKAKKASRKKKASPVAAVPDEDSGALSEKEVRKMDPKALIGYLTNKGEPPSSFEVRWFVKLYQNALGEQTKVPEILSRFDATSFRDLAEGNYLEFCRAVYADLTGQADDEGTEESGDFDDFDL